MMYLTLICFLFSIAAPLVCQEPLETGMFVSEDFLQDDAQYDSNVTAPPIDPWVLRFEGGYTVGKFAGFSKSYGEAGLFVAPRSSGNWLPFADVRGYLIGNGKRAYGVGFGLRRWSDWTIRAFGGNAFYNYQEGRFGAFHRIGLGFESLGDDFDIRVNGYLIVNGDMHKGRIHTFHYLAGFMETCQMKEKAVSGIDAELGGDVWQRSGFSLYCAAGPYYYQANCFRIYGGYLRGELRWWEHLKLIGCISEDNESHTQYQAKIWVSFPLDKLFTRDPSYEFGKHYILTQPVQRNPMISTQQCCNRITNW